MRWMGAASASSTPGLAAGFIAVAICAAGGAGAAAVGSQSGAEGERAHRRPAGRGQHTQQQGGVMGGGSLAGAPPPAPAAAARPQWRIAACHHRGSSSHDPRCVHGMAKRPSPLTVSPSQRLV